MTANQNKTTVPSVDDLSATLGKARDMKVELNKGGQFAKNLATALTPRISAFEDILKSFAQGYASPTSKLADDIDALFAASGHLADAARLLAPKVVTDNRGGTTQTDENAS